MPIDPNAPWAWAPAEWDVPMAGGEFAPPAPVPPIAPADFAAMPEQSNWDFAKDALSMDSVRDLAADTRDAVAPALAPIDMTVAQRALSEKIAPPRTDQARVAQATGPIGTVGQIGKDVDPATQQQPAIGELPTFSPDEMASLGITPPPFIGQPRRDLGTMPDDFVGGPGNTGFVEMPDDFAGHELGPQDPYGDVATGPAADLARGISGAANAIGGAVARTPDAIDSRSPQMPDELLSDEELGQKLAGLPLEQQEMERAKIEGARQRFASARVLDASTRAQRDAEENARIYQDSIKAAQARSLELDAEAQNLARKNPLDSITGSQKIFGVLASIVGGWAANKTGRNMGLEIVDQIANEAAQNHATKLALNARQQGAVGDQVTRAQDSYKAAEGVRLATYDGAIRSLETEVQNFDPRGTTALRVMDQINTLKMKRAELLAKYRDQELDRTEKLLKEQRELTKLGLESDHWQRQDRNDSTRAGADWLRAKTDEKKANKELEANNPKARKDEADAVEAEAKAAAAREGYAIKNPETGDVIKNPDGTPVVEMDATKRNRTSGIIEAAQNIRRLADKMAALKKKYGGAVKALGSEESQEIQSLAGMVKFETFKAFDLGAPSAGDQALAEAASGGVDPTSFVRDATPGFLAFADSVEKKANTALRNSGYKGAALHFTRRSDAKPAERSVVDTVVGRLATAPDHDIAIGGGVGGVNFDPKTIEAMGGTIPKSDEVRNVENDITILASYAEQPKTAAEARAALEKLASSAVSGRVRERAKAALNALPGANERTERAR